MPLSSDDCPLVPERIVQLFNRLDESVAKVRGTLPRLWDKLAAPDGTTSLGASLLPRFDALGNTLQLSRYRVGFVGRSQVGKSTTFNHVLGVSKADSPSKEGRGEPTTSAVTRLSCLPPTATPSCDLVYMTRHEFQQRRNDLCRLNGLSEYPLSERGKDHSTLKAENQELLAQCYVSERTTPI